MTDKMHSMSNAISSCGSSNAACLKTMTAALADRPLTLESHTHKGGNSLGFGELGQSEEVERTGVRPSRGLSNPPGVSVLLHLMQGLKHDDELYRSVE